MSLGVAVPRGGVNPLVTFTRAEEDYGRVKVITITYRPLEGPVFTAERRRDQWNLMVRERYETEFAMHGELIDDLKAQIEAYNAATQPIDND